MIDQGQTQPDILHPAVYAVRPAGGKNCEE